MCDCLPPSSVYLPPSRLHAPSKRVRTWVKEGQASGSTARMTGFILPASFSRKKGKARPPKLLQGGEGRGRAATRRILSRQPPANHGEGGDCSVRFLIWPLPACPTLLPCTRRTSPAAAGAAHQQVGGLPHLRQLLECFLANHSLQGSRRAGR